MKAALIGVGLIGGSAAAAWKHAGLVSEVIGYDLDPRAVTDGVALGVLDRGADSIGAAVSDADLVVLAIPVGAMPAVLAAVAAAVPAHAIVTDVGSTKCSVIDAARQAFAAGSSFSFRRFVPGHPIAGRERPGVAAADRDLFRGRLFIVTPVAETHPDALTMVESLWRGIGARVEIMTPQDHDRVFAAVSHLPHLLSFALVAQIAAAADAERKLALAGAGFRDFTRIAASSPRMWRDIALANRSALGAELRAYRDLLERLQAAVDNGDAATLEATFVLASDARRRAHTDDAD
jgi:prephenate dehydrogenase